MSALSSRCRQVIRAVEGGAAGKVTFHRVPELSIRGEKAGTVLIAGLKCHQILQCSHIATGFEFSQEQLTGGATLVVVAGSTYLLSSLIPACSTNMLQVRSERRKHSA